MLQKKSPPLIRFLLVLMLTASFQLTAAPGRILDSVEAEQANKEAFAAEEKLFESIGQSIALSLAYCKLESDCKPSVDSEELETLIDKLDNRINNLVIKQESSEEDYTELLTAYVSHRESYIDYQDQLEQISTVEGPAAEDTGEDVFADEETETEDVVQQEEDEEAEFSVFEDVGEALPGTGADALSEETPPEE